MSSELQTDADMGGGGALPPPNDEPAALVVPGLTDNAVADTGREVRLSQLGAMVSQIVHDLRQYIAVVHGVAELLQERVITVDTAAMLLRAANGMTRMTQEILDFARGVGQVALGPVPVRALVAALDEVALSRLEGRGIRVERRIHSAGAVQCDRDLLMRALLNLIANAGEAMPEGGVLALTVADTDHAVVFRVQDTGHGIVGELLPTVFDPFVTHGKSGGTGLGLAITREIVRAHGGSIGVDSTAGQGTTFVITIPRPRADAEALAQPCDPAAALEAA